MDLLVVEPLEAEVMQWLAARHATSFAPELARDPRALKLALYPVRAMIVPPSVAVDAETVRAAPLLQAVGRVSAGAENVDLEVCGRAGIEVVRGLTATAQAEAEFMIGALLSMLRRVPVQGADGMRVGRELGGASVGLVGVPPSARIMAQLLDAFGAKAFGYDPARHANDGLWGRWRIQPLGLCELLERCDAVCVQLGYFSRYKGLLGERFLPRCKPEQVIVSLSHSGLFDEVALAEALESGRIAAVWLDSLEPGALAAGRPLSGIPTLQITPRLASTTRESRQRSAWAVARRIDELLSLGTPAQLGFRPTLPGAPFAPADDPASP